jgi:hypothetical protein
VSGRVVGRAVAGVVSAMVLVSGDMGGVSGRVVVVGRVGLVKAMFKTSPWFIVRLICTILTLVDGCESWLGDGNCMMSFAIVESLR